MHFLCPPALVHYTPMAWFHTDAAAPAVGSRHCWDTAQQFWAFKSLLPCLFPWQSQVPDPEAMLLVSVLTNLPETT